MSDFPPDSALVQRVLVSPNHDKRASPPDMILLHYTGMRSAEAALKRLCDPDARVSAHYVVMENSDIYQLVLEEERAWHAGISSWEGETDINSRSIGIEIANPGHDFGYPDFPDAQIEAVTGLCRDILARRKIPPGRVLAHSDVAPSR
jgi:N-acetylmuramoyl-L-alanine amidase